MAFLVGPMHTLHVQTQARSNMLHYDGPRTVSQRMTASLPRHGEHPREEPKYCTIQELTSAIMGPRF